MKTLISLLLLFGTIMATTTSSTCKWLKDIIEYYKTKFKEDGHTTLTIKATLVVKPESYEDSEAWSLDSILVLMVLIKESKAAGLIHRAFRCITQASKLKQLKTEANVSETSTPNELLLIMDNNLQARLPSLQISHKMIKNFLLPQMLEDWLNLNKISKEIRRKNKRERVGAGGRLFKASGGGRGGHHSGWVTAGHHGNIVGDGHHIGWVTRGHHKGEGPGRTYFPSTNRGGSGWDNWVKNYHHGSGANVRDKGGPFIGCGPGSTNFPSTVHYGGGKIKGIQYADSTESWGKYWYHGGDRFGKNYHPSGGASDKGRTGSVIGGGPRGIPVPTSTRHGDTGRGVNFESIKETTNKHRYYGGNTVGENYYHTGGGSERGRSSPIIGGGPEITHLPSTILFVGGTDSRGKKYQYSSGVSDKDRNGTIIGGGPRDTHVTSTVLYRGGRDRGEHHLLNDWGKIHHHSSRVSDRARDGLIIGGGPKESRLPSTNRQDSSGWGRVTYYADVGERVKNRYNSGVANYRSRDGPNIGSGPTRTTASDTSRGGHIIGGGPKRTHLPPTIYHRSGIGVMSDQQSSVNEWQKRGYHGVASSSWGGSNGEIGKGSKIIGGVPTRTHFSTTSYIFESTPKYRNN